MSLHMIQTLDISITTTSPNTTYLSMCHEFIRRQMYKQRDISVLDLILLAEGPIFSSYAYF